jgi:hypothetical protein
VSIDADDDYIFEKQLVVTTAGKLVALLRSLQIISKRKQPQGRVHNVISASGKVQAGYSVAAFYD